MARSSAPPRPAFAPVPAGITWTLMFGRSDISAMWVSWSAMTCAELIRWCSTGSSSTTTTCGASAVPGWPGRPSRTATCSAAASSSSPVARNSARATRLSGTSPGRAAATTAAALRCPFGLQPAFEPARDRPVGPARQPRQPDDQTVRPGGEQLRLQRLGHLRARRTLASLRLGDHAAVIAELAGSASWLEKPAATRARRSSAPRNEAGLLSGSSIGTPFVQSWPIVAYAPAT